VNHVMMQLMRTMIGGAIVLVVPAFAVCAGVTYLAYRRRGGGGPD